MCYSVNPGKRKETANTGEALDKKDHTTRKQQSRRTELSVPKAVAQQRVLPF